MNLESTPCCLSLKCFLVASAVVSVCTYRWCCWKSDVVGSHGDGAMWMWDDDGAQLADASACRHAEADEKPPLQWERRRQQWTSCWWLSLIMVPRKSAYYGNLMDNVSAIGGVGWWCRPPANFFNKIQRGAARGRSGIATAAEVMV